MKHFFMNRHFIDSAQRSQAKGNIGNRQSESGKKVYFLSVELLKVSEDIVILSIILKEWNMLISTRCVCEFMQISDHTFALLLRNMEDMECLKLTVKVLNDLASRIKSSGK